MIFLKLSSDITFNSDYQEYNNNHQLNYQFKYSKNISKFNLTFENSLQKSNNKIFDQVNSINQFNTRIGTSIKRVNHGLLLTYKRKYDHYPQYQLHGDVTENQYLTGYFMDISLTDSLVTSSQIQYAISQEDNPNISNSDFTNKGYIARVSTNYGFRLSDNNFHLDLIYNNDNRNRNYKNQIDINMNHYLDNDLFYFYNQLYYQASQDDIFKLVNEDYEQTDTQNRDNFRLVTQLANNYGDKLHSSLESIFSKNNNRLKKSNNRTSKDESIDLSLELDYKIWQQLSVFMQNNYSLSYKDFSESSNNRESDTKKVKIGVNISSTFFDSISVSQTLEKTSTNFPNATLGFDNDYVSEITWVNFRKLFAETLNLNNQFSYSKIQDIYINSKYSASNNIKTSYSYQPNIDFLVGDNLLISQLYSIRINYDDYLYDSITNSDATLTIYDRFYRQVSAEFKIRYDNSPVRNTLNKTIWKIPNNLIELRDNVNIIFSYKYFANETGDKRSDVYETTGENQKHDVYIEAEKNFGPINLALKPKAAWGNTEIYEIESVFTYNQSEDTNVSISLKPKYEVGNHEFVYTINTMIGLRF